MSKVNKIITSQLTLFKNIKEYYDNFLSNFPESTLRSGDVDILQECKDEENKNQTYYTDSNYSLEEVEEDFTISYGNFLSLKNRLLKKENRAATNQQQTPTPVQSHSTLPKIPLPNFEGDQVQWDSFKEIFKARVVDDESILPVFKLQHLLSHVKGDAARRLAGMELTEDNFNVAWNILQRRYDNKKLRLSTHLSRLISAPAVSSKASNGITLLLDTFEGSIRALRGLERPVDEWGDWFVYLIVSKLDAGTRSDWEKSRESDTAFSTYEQLTTFLENRARTLSSSSPANPPSSSSSKSQGAHNSSHKKSSVSVHATSAGASRESSGCAICQQENHSLTKCPKFSQMAISQRRASVPSSSCYNCLGYGHRKDKYSSKFRCRTCGGRHHTLLHQDNAVEEAVENQPAQKSSTQSITVCTTHVGGRVLMATALVTLASESAHLTVRALLDPAAEESFVTEHIAQALRLKKQPVSTTVTGVGGETSTPPTSQVSINLRSNAYSKFTMNFSALVMRKLTNFLPNEQVQRQNWPHIQGLRLADPEYHRPGRIDCILGAEVYAVILCQGLRQGPYPSPMAQKTVFGWVLTGSFKSASSPGTRVSCHVTTTETTVDEQLRMFWEVEEPPKTTLLSPEEEACEAHFQNTHQRDASGRFVLRLPFKQVPDLPGIQEIARARFLSCERRLQANPKLHQAYCQFMQEYLDLGHMEKVPKEELPQENSSYLPHHGVFKADGSGKIRVVFNASQKAKNGMSLNNYLHTGPKLQSELVGVLTRWRFFQFVFTADIVKMFRQFKLHKHDCDWLRILWRPSKDQPIQTYRLLTVTYGTAPAPFQAIRSLKQLASDEVDNFPRGAEILRNNSYVDDNLGGAHDITTAIQARDELIALLATAGMQLDKWSSNDPRINFGEDSAPSTELDFGEIVSTLGLQWSPANDWFQYKVKPPQRSSCVTKRSMLSEIASLFDPLGWLAPVIVVAKVYIQELWIRSLDWDQQVDDDLHQAWLVFQGQLPDIETIKIPRWLHTNQNLQWELHGFADASEQAFAATIYVVTSEGQSYNSTLLIAKTKVAPVKKLSVPRLELCGAQLLARKISAVRKELPSSPASIFCWSDSKTVLAWLKGHPSRWSTFVGNRVSEVITSIPEANWGHVNTLENPADLATRGASPVQLNESDIWWRGPNWLSQGPEFWPKSQDQLSTNCEVKTSTRVFKAVVEDTSLLNWMSRYSTLNKLLNALSPLYRWKLQSKTIESEKEAVAVRARSCAKLAIIRVTQRHFFKEEIQSIRAGQRIKSSLLVQTTLRQEYWIIHDRSQIRKAIKNCVRCLRFQGSSQQQIMAPLPMVRLQPSRPFTYTGVDYAGPFNTRASRGRGHTSFKSYVAVFVCMVTKAVHLELVSDYSSNAFIAAYRRFTSRRGLCTIMYSDHGTTFQGAVTEIHKLFDQHSSFMKEVAGMLETDGVEWSFIPPKGPHFGGLWESKVKSFKHHLNRVAANSTLTFEEFSTLLTQIEACLNSRPLSPMTSDSSDPNALTPGHFLIGGPLNLLPGLYTAAESSRTPIERWQIVQKMLGDLWRRWRKEVFHDLQQRSKWLDPHRNLQLNDIVIIQDDLSPPGRWALGRVIKCHPGPDGRVRSVTLKTATSCLVRPIVKLILLPVNSKAEDGHTVVKVD